MLTVNERRWYAVAPGPKTTGSPGIDPAKGLDEQLKQLIRSGRKLEAIKMYRQQAGVGLKEAKDFIGRHF